MSAKPAIEYPSSPVVQADMTSTTSPEDEPAKIDLTTFPPALSELFSAFDHLLRAQDEHREYHLEWVTYHWRRFTNALGPRSETERAMWKQLSARIRGLQTNADKRAAAVAALLEKCGDMRGSPIGEAKGEGIWMALKALGLSGGSDD